MTVQLVNFPQRWQRSEQNVSAGLLQAVGGPSEAQTIVLLTEWTCSVAYYSVSNQNYTVIMLLNVCCDCHYVSLSSNRSFFSPSGRMIRTWCTSLWWRRGSRASSAWEPRPTRTTRTIFSEVPYTSLTFIWFHFFCT